MSNFRPSFLTISIPDLDWLHELIHNYNQGAELSISHHLVDLVGKDLRDRQVLTTAQWNQIRQLTGTRTRSTVQKKFKNLSWYVPYPVLEWLPGKITEVAKSRSFYVWNLFVKAHRDSIPPQFLAEWGDPDKIDLSASRVQIKRAPMSAEQARIKLEEEKKNLAKRQRNLQKQIDALAPQKDKPKKSNRKAS